VVVDLHPRRLVDCFRKLEAQLRRHDPTDERAAGRHVELQEPPFGRPGRQYSRLLPTRREVDRPLRVPFVQLLQPRHRREVRRADDPDEFARVELKATRYVATALEGDLTNHSKVAAKRFNCQANDPQACKNSIWTCTAVL
jgi:hypothetical protein